MLDGMPLIDVHLHAARLPTLKLPRETWLQGFAASASMAAELSTPVILARGQRATRAAVTLPAPQPRS